MKKTVILILLVCLMLTACGSQENDILTVEKAQQIVLEDLGVSADEVSMHVHVGSGDIPSYSIYVTVGEESYEYVIDAATGQILSISESTHSH